MYLEQKGSKEVFLKKNRIAFKTNNLTPEGRSDLSPSALLLSTPDVQVFPIYFLHGKVVINWDTNSCCILPEYKKYSIKISHFTSTHQYWVDVKPANIIWVFFRLATARLSRRGPASKTCHGWETPACWCWMIINPEMCPWNTLGSKNHF